MEANENPAKIAPYMRWLIERDLHEVYAIERHSFEFPWLDDDFRTCLRQRNCIAMVAEHNEKVVGFFIYELHKNRFHVLNFAVDPIYRRSGVGQAMIEKLIDKLAPQRRTRIMLKVRESNLQAQLFFKAMGFRAIKVVPDFYCDTDEAAYLFQYRYRRELPPPSPSTLAGSRFA